jgi:hypothetical protein
VTFNRNLECLHEPGTAVDATGASAAPLNHGHTTDQVLDIEGVVGYQGPAGPQGEQGEPGTSANEWYSDEGIPSGGMGAIGDFYLNELNGDVWEKTGIATWTYQCNIKGPQGNPGLDGADGADGIGVPIGGIIMWSGTIATVPSGFAFCNGTDNSPGPDLRDKFVVCAKQDDAGAAKTNLEGTLSVTGGATGHLHSAHAALSHSGFSLGDHTGLTHNVLSLPTVSHTHAGLTHAAVSLPGMTHADISVASAAGSAAGATHPLLTIEGQTHAVLSVPSAGGSAAGATHPLLTIEGATHAVLSVPSATGSAPGVSHANVSMASGITGSGVTVSHSQHATLGLSLSSTGTARTIVTGSTAHPTHPVPTVSLGAFTVSITASHPTGIVSMPAFSYTLGSHPTFTASAPASHPTGAVSMPAFSYTLGSHPTFTASAVASHPTGAVSMPAFTYSQGTLGSHPTVTASPPASHPTFDGTGGTFTSDGPTSHGSAGTITHSFGESSAHSVSLHDTVSQLVPYYALAFIQRMA